MLLLSLLLPTRTRKREREEGRQSDQIIKKSEASFPFLPPFFFVLRLISAPQLLLPATTAIREESMCALLLSSRVSLERFNQIALVSCCVCLCVSCSPRACVTQVRARHDGELGAGLGCLSHSVGLTESVTSGSASSVVLAISSSLLLITSDQTITVAVF